MRNLHINLTNSQRVLFSPASVNAIPRRFANVGVTLSLRALVCGLGSDTWNVDIINIVHFINKLKRIVRKT